MYIYIHVYIHIHMYIYVCTHTYIYSYIASWHLFFVQGRHGPSLRSAWAANGGRRDESKLAPGVTNLYSRLT